MKVPKMYRSSDRYNAGTDVIYNDESKLQYAPFIYATTESGDSGDGGDDEEGEDVMVVHILENESSNVLDKNWSEIKGALSSGKLVYVIHEYGETEIEMFYISWIGVDNEDYTVKLRYLEDITTDMVYTSSSATNVLVLNDLG